MESVKSVINTSLKVISIYEWLLDLYVLDFFIDDHWNKLPKSWRNVFQNLDPKGLGNIFSGETSNHVMPLSFLSLIATVRSLSLRRQNSHRVKSVKIGGSCCGTHPKLKNLFLKHVKLKKRHEISLMADIVKDTARQSKCEAVIDFGSGIGHLVRKLAYKYDLYAIGIECQNQLTEEARKLDRELEYTASKHLSSHCMSNLRRPIHFNITLSCNDQLHRLDLPDTMKEYGLVGLHPCGDLGPLLLRHFVANKHVKFICVVGCCYMKLTCNGEVNGYPMSNYVKQLDNKLSYASREIACHAIEMYTERLKRGNYEDLKVHAYRAALERILVQHDPKLRHVQIRSVKNANTMSFHRYCELAVQKLGILSQIDGSAWSRGDHDVAEWRKVVTIYSLRLVLAPLVETVILLDRVLYVLEHGLSCEIRPVFDPSISPRNHIIIAKR